MLHFCTHCINPRGLGVIDLATEQEVSFREVNGEVICSVCETMISSGVLPTRKQFNQQFENFLGSSQRILFAYSGGLDSTSVLTQLIDECQKRSIELVTFTVNTGVKGKTTEQNIGKVLQHLRIESSHFFVDISNEIQTDPVILETVQVPMTTFETYKLCLDKNILPCGRICNTMMDKTYARVMERLDFHVMVTGGDTPKKNKQGVYSLFWAQPHGMTIVRGGYGFAMTKRSNAAIIKDRRIPWEPPQCGGYDTDCLIPGVFFAKDLGWNHKQGVETVIAKYPIILQYLSERVRFGVINRNDGLEMLTQVDISSRQSYCELMKIFGRE